MTLRRLDEITRAALPVDPSDELAIWQSGRTRAVALAAVIASVVQPAVDAAILAALAGPWAASAPAVAPATGTLGAGVIAALRSKILGRTVNFTLRVSIPLIGTGAGDIRVTMPVPAYAANGTMFAFSGRNVATGTVVRGTLVGSTLTIVDSAGAFPAANGAILIITGAYEAA